MDNVDTFAPTIRRTCEKIDNVIYLSSKISSRILSILKDEIEIKSDFISRSRERERERKLNEITN